MPRRLRIGIVGLHRGVSLLRVFARHPAAEVVAVCDRQIPRVESVAAEFSVPGVYTRYDDLLHHGLDVVVVASPLPDHAAHSIAALNAGVHVLSEVPAVASIPEAEALVRAVRASSASYMLAENCNYWAFVESWATMTEAGRIGDPMYAEAEYIHDCRPLLRHADGRPTWRATLPPIQYCTHSLGPLLKIIGGRCLTATGLSSGSRLTPELGTLDMQVGLFRTERGVPIKVLCGFGVARQPAFHTYTVYGTRGCLEKPRPGTDAREETLAFFDDVPEMLGMASLPLGTRHRGAPAHASAGGHGTAEYAMIHAYMSCLTEGRPVPIDVHAGLDMTLPGLCAHESSLRGGAVVDVPDFR